MSTIRTSPPGRASARQRLLDAGVDLIRTKGYAATSVDELCAAAGVTKGAFFHHFESKAALGVAVANHWTETTSALFAAAPYHRHADPLDRIFAYLGFRLELIDGPIEAFTCLVGTMVQEIHTTHPELRDACEASMSRHARTLEADLAAVIADRGVTGVTAESLALYTQVVLQGAFILSKAKGGPDIAREAVGHLKRYFSLLFGVEAAS
jgi:TetR/AcrR family transcriptional regulator, transcriptional repressor for nem operon